MNATRWIAVSLAAMCVGPVLAMPTKDDLAKTMPKVGQMLAVQESALRAGTKTHSAAAAELVAMACESASEAEKLLLFKAAMGFYVRDGDEKMALDTLKTLQEEIPDITPQHVLNVYGSAVGKRKVEKGSPLGDYVAKMMADARPAAVGDFPRVVKIFPANGDTNVNPKTSKIVITFDCSMDGGCSFCPGLGGGGDSHPEVAGRPSWNKEMTQVSIPVKLRPGWEYVVCLNRDGDESFRNVLGKPLRGCSYAFKTSAATEPPAPAPPAKEVGPAN